MQPTPKLSVSLFLSLFSLIYLHLFVFVLFSLFLCLIFSQTTSSLFLSFFLLFLQTENHSYICTYLCSQCSLYLSFSPLYRSVFLSILCLSFFMRCCSSVRISAGLIALSETCLQLRPSSVLAERTVVCWARHRAQTHPQGVSLL